MTNKKTIFSLGVVSLLIVLSLNNFKVLPGDELTVQFQLPAGGYATAVLREIQKTNGKT